MKELFTQELLEELITHRRTLHRIPEAGMEEFKTRAYIQGILDGLAIPYETVAGTGVIGIIAAKGRADVDKFPTIAFRADMDALSMAEETGVDYASTHSGFMHACGHDGHMSILLGLAKVLKASEAELTRDVVLIFQPAEEGPGGARPIVESGILQKLGVTAVYGLHLYPEVEEGKFALRKGAMMAMTGEFDIDIYGKGGHGAIPHKALDAAVIAAEFLLGVQTIVSRFVNPIQPAVLTFGRIEAGERRNIIAKSARLEGTLRTFDQGVFKLICDRVRKHLEGLCTIYGCTYDMEIREMYPPVVNAPELVDIFTVANRDEFDIQTIEPQMIAEDFSEYQQVMPGLFVYLGTRNEAEDRAYPLHNSKFCFDEGLLLQGVKGFYNVAMMIGDISDIEGTQSKSEVDNA